MMRWCLALLLCSFLAVINALSSSGSRLLVVLDESAEKSAYSTLWSDLEGNQLVIFSVKMSCTDLNPRTRIRCHIRNTQEQQLVPLSAWRASL